MNIIAGVLLFAFIVFPRGEDLGATPVKLVVVGGDRAGCYETTRVYEAEGATASECFLITGSPGVWEAP